MTDNASSLVTALEKITLISTIIFIFILPWRGAILLEGGASIGRWWGIGTGIIWVVYKVAAREFRQPHAPQFLAVAFFLWVAASLWWSIDPDTTFGVVVRLATTLGAFFIVWDMIDTHRRILFALQSFVAGTAVTISIVLYTFFTAHGVSYRIYVDIFNINHVAGTIVLSMPIAWYLAGEVDHRWAVWSNISIILLGSFAIVVTGSRQSIAALCLILIWIAVSAKFRYEYSTATYVSGFIITALLLLYLIRTIPNLILERAVTTFTAPIRGDFQGREEIWLDALWIATDNLVTGIGAGAYVRTTHNVFVGLFTELGLVGLVLFVVFCGATFTPHLKTGQATQYARLWLLLIVATAPLLMMNDWHYEPTLWVLLALVASTARPSATWLLPQRARANRRTSRRRQPPRIAPESRMNDKF